MGRGNYTLRLDDETDEWLDDFSDENNSTRSDVVNRAVKVYAAKLARGDWQDPRFKDGIDKNQWSMLFLIRLVPAVPFFAANIVPALVNVPLYRFFVSTFLGIIPGAIVYTSVGAGLGEVFARGETPDLGIIFAPHILLPILGLCLLAALPILLKAVRGKKGL